MEKLRNDRLVDNKMNVRQAVRHALYLGSAVALAGSLMLAGPAIAQDEDEELEEVIVTGSRLSRSGFDSPTPMDIVNVRDAIALGYSNTADMLMSQPALAGSDQMTDVLSGILANVNGGQGVQTADLRGLGAGRTLSLLNGRRAGPAGIRDGVTSFDINVIPVSALERVEILKDGASSIYGSDAIGGVINYITRKGDGGEFNAYTQMAEESGGETLQINGSYGRESDKGYWRVTADYNKQEQILRGDREIFDCYQEYIFNEPNLQTRADVIDPSTGRYKCYGFDAGSVWIYDYHYGSPSGGFYNGGEDLSNVTPTSTRVVYDYNGEIAASGLLPDRNNGANDPADLRVPEGFYILPEGALGESLRGTSGDYLDKTVMVPERERITLMANGEYNISDSMTLYSEVLLNRRETQHGGVSQLWTYNYTSDYEYSHYSYTYDYYYDYTTYEYVYYNYEYTYHFEPGGDAESAGWTGAQLLDPIIAYNVGGASTKVDYIRGVFGALGDIGSSDWSYDASLQYSKSDGEYVDNVLYDDARYFSVNRTPFWAGPDRGLCEGTTFDRLGPDGEVRQAGIPCMDINFLDPRILAGEFNDAERDFLNGTEFGTTEYTNVSFDIGFTNNDLFSMPAGNFGLAVGAQYMTDEIADTPGIESRSGNNWDGSWGRGSAKIFGTYGETDTTAAYVETRTPLLADKPGFDYLELNVSARYTSVGIDDTEDSAARTFDDTTYKVGLDWRINDNFRVRASTGTSFRTPALFELYRKNFHTYPGQINDPCNRWGAALAADDSFQQIADNCAAEGIPDDINSLIPMDVTTGGGAAVLDPETSDSRTFGIVFTAPEIDFRMSVDYWDLEVEDQIGTFSASGILNGCYTSDTFPDEQLCSLFERESGQNQIEKWRVITVQSSYINLDLQRVAGVDIEATYGTTIFNDINLTINTSHTITTTKETESVEGEINSRKGRAGNPEWVANLTFRLSKGPWSGAWRTNYFDGTDNNREGIATSGSWIGLSGEEETFYYSRTLDSRLYHNASATYSFGDGWQANLSITNITDELPPRATRGAGVNVEGYGAFHSQYDWKGRRYGLNIKKTF
jgi:iron complex outermembrane receptor protein